MSGEEEEGGERLATGLDKILKPQGDIQDFFLH